MGSAVKKNGLSVTKSGLEPGNWVIGLSGGAHPLLIKVERNPGIRQGSYAGGGKKSAVQHS